jgi:hypothetical protein
MVAEWFANELGYDVEELTISDAPRMSVKDGQLKLVCDECNTPMVAGKCPTCIGGKAA